MRISLEGQPAETGQNLSGNCLKDLKKTFQRFFEKAVDKVAVQCRMRTSN